MLPDNHWARSLATQFTSRSPTLCLRHFQFANGAVDVS